MTEIASDSRVGRVHLTRIVTVHRQWAFVAEWLSDGSLRQDGVEWIVVNDAPHDHAPAHILSALQDLGARLLVPPRNLGRCGARNLGARAASGDWLEHIDGDDRPLPIVNRWFEVREDVGCLLFPVCEREDLRDVGHMKVLEWDVSTHTYWGFLFPGQRPIDPRPAGVIWRRSAFDALGGYDDRLQCSEDLELMHRAVRARIGFSHVGSAKQLYRLHRHTSFRAQKDYRDSLEFFMKVRGEVASDVAVRLDLLLGRQCIAFGGQFMRECWRLRGSVVRFLWSRFSGRFRNFNRLP